jgi:phenylacetate-coenzyme A ligase PaaK-like adenylate-forming protein
VPFLPVEFFKRHKIISGNQPEEIVFESSGTTGSNVSRHYVSDISLYEKSFLRCFRLFYNDPEDYFIAALLPTYTEKKNSSLVYMMDKLIKRSRNPLSGFYHDEVPELISNIKKEKEGNRKILIMSVSFTLIDLAEHYSPDLSDVIVMETGGMKGRRKEITRRELHSILKKGLNIADVHSEYGMTELLSQAYSKGNEIFHCPPWMKILVRDTQDPLSVITEPGITGGINIIDLANINSCSFIATQDLGKLHEEGGFEVLGRFDNSDIRGCNLLIE